MSPGALPLPDIWGNGQLLAFSGVDGPTDYDAGIVARTTREPFGIAVMRPAPAVLVFGASSAQHVQLTNDTFEVSTDLGEVRGAFVDAWHLLLEGTCRIASSDPQVVVLKSGTKTLVASRSRFQPAYFQLDLNSLISERRKWFKQQPTPANLTPRQSRTLAKAISTMKGQVCTSQGLIRHRWTTPDRWPHRDLWLWDSVFHAMGWRHLNPALAREMIEAVFDGQQPDGRIPHQLNPHRTSAITQPPVLAFGVQQVLEIEAADDWIAHLYPRLAHYLEWDFEHRIPRGNGLAQWYIEGDPHSRSGESGMDNSPRFDAAIGLDAVDLNSFLSLECFVMAEFAQKLGLASEAGHWLSRHRELNQLINARLWNPDAGFYFDFDPIKRRTSDVYAVTGFLPMLCGAADEQKTGALAAHATNPKTFGTLVPLPSAVVGKSTPDPDDMWRGPMWINTNWLTALGFERCGRKDLAKQIREAARNEVERWYLDLGTIFEFYDSKGVTPPDRLPRKGMWDPKLPYHQAIHDYGWSNTLYADLSFTA